MDAHRSVEHAAHQLRRRRAPQALLDRVGERERVERGVPVAELVARREARDSGRGGERDRRGELDLARTGPQRPQQCVEDLLRLSVEDDLDEARAIAPGASPGERLGQLLEGGFEQRDEVDRVAPGVGLLHPLGERELRRQRGQHRLGPLPARGVERLQGLVDEVERVPAVQVAVVGGGGEEHVGELLRRGAGANGRDDRPLRAVGVAHLDEAAEPAAQPFRIHLARQRVERKPRRLHRRVGGDVRQTVVEGGGPLRPVEPRHEVHQAGQRRQPAEPAPAAAQSAELEPGAKGVGPARVGLGHRDRSFREDERDVPPEPVVEALPLMRDRVAG